MKTAYLLLLTLSSIACLLARPLPGGDGAVIKANSPLPRGERVPRPARSSTGTGRVRGLSARSSPTIKRSTHFSNNHPRPTRANALNTHQQVTTKSAGPAKSPARIVAPAITDLRHRNPNPAVLGGPVKSQVNGTGSISGTGMNRRR